MLSPKKDDSNNDSDNDEGFVVNTIEINQKERPKIIITSTERPNDYQPRYLNSNLLIKYHYKHPESNCQNSSPPTRTSPMKTCPAFPKYPAEETGKILARYKNGPFPIKTTNWSISVPIKKSPQIHSLPVLLELARTQRRLDQHHKLRSRQLLHSEALGPQAN